MKKILSYILICALLLGCTPLQAFAAGETDIPDFQGLDDPTLLRYVEDDIYDELIDSLDSDEYFVENVSAVYVSNEYLEELAFNSQSNIFFGYTLEELDEQFQGTRYVFTMAEDGGTEVEFFEAYDDTYERVIKNVAVGTGVILVCVTVSAVTAGSASAAAVNLIFAASAKSGAIFALSSGVLGGVSAGVVKGMQTGDFDEAIKAGALAGSEDFKWGAISGALTSGAIEAVKLKWATRSGLTMNEVALILRESKYPLSILRNIHSMEEYEIYKKSNLLVNTVNKNKALVQSIDWDFVGDAADGRTNWQRVIDGLSPLDPTGKPYELHHIGQHNDSPLAILTNAVHHSSENFSVLHGNTGKCISEVNRIGFEKIREDFWMNLLEKTWEGGEILLL